MPITIDGNFMTTFQTLENISTEKILEVFNLAFSDYVIPLSLTMEQLEDKIKSDNIRLEFSVGAFDNNQLIAFILHGYNQVDEVKQIYNAGTGVIPDSRGNKLTAKMYEYILPILQENNIDKIILEVITENKVAIKVYQKIGFKTIRHLDSFKGLINISNTINDFEIRNLDRYDWQKLQHFWDFNPSWQNSISAVEKLKQYNISFGVYENEILLGYIIYNPKQRRIHQLSVDKNFRNRGIGRQLLKYISTNYESEISIINIDENAKEVPEFLYSVGIKDFIKQYEMELVLK